MFLSDEEIRNYLIARISPSESFKDLLQFPRFFEIETVHNCNARCSSCTIRESQREKKVMSPVLFEKILKEISLHASSVKRVSLYRDGEPLLDTMLPSRIRMMKEMGVRNVTISTNGSLLSEERCSEILLAGLDTIIISIDALDEETYKQIRVGLNFHHVIENTYRLIALRNRLNPSTKIWVRMVRQKKNWDQWPDFEQFWAKKLGLNDRVNYHLIHNWGGALKTSDDDVFENKTLFPCVALFSQFIILADGSVPNCSVDCKLVYPNGTLHTDSIFNLWHSKDLISRRNLHFSGRKNEMNICKGCNAFDDPPDMTCITSKYEKKIRTV